MSWSLTSRPATSTDLIVKQPNAQQFAFPRQENARAVKRSPSRDRGCRECRALIAPAALRATRKSTQASHHRYAETIRHSPRNGFTVYPALSPVYRAL